MSRLSRHARVALASTMVASFAVATFAATSGAATSPARSAHTPYPACTANGLVNWIDTQGNGAAGTIYFNLKFTNLSGHTCTMNGYPGVSAVDLSNHQVGAAAARVSATVHPLTIANGGTVRANLGIVETGNFSSSNCHATTAAGLRVYAPNQTVAKIVPFPFSTCTTSTSVLKIYPVL